MRRERFCAVAAALILWAVCVGVAAAVMVTIFEAWH